MPLGPPAEHVRVEVLPGACHHSIPVEHVGPLGGLLLDFLPDQCQPERG